MNGEDVIHSFRVYQLRVESALKLEVSRQCPAGGGTLVPASHSSTPERRPSCRQFLEPAHAKASARPSASRPRGVRAANFLLSPDVQHRAIAAPWTR